MIYESNVACLGYSSMIVGSIVVYLWN